MRRGQAGFTMIELLVAIAILGVIAAILIPNFIRARAGSQLAAAQLDFHHIVMALEMYYWENQAYPPAASWESDLESGGYIRAVPRSPVDRAPYGYATDAARTRFVLWDGPDKYIQAGSGGYIVYTVTGGLEVGVTSVPTP
ncbi:MAG: type II secretion system protein [Armatimonadota bacterium]|nr:type II secretion system protein [Armatimonadota bacterium]MDR7437834.1 type II secretion system protein [Armatimonadota bacterium]MDR7507464.1 type II secretion system protein [Armatimonadota bacterium]MDR7508792.1 type II secretion system protein [Armatimonadota bacterium]MDR7517781.1 type II secretion system protein [Armatimonadota bacterium]